ncbi:hypothetical protein L6164_011569 [Bauhinia variegata]|uniref:Uncharacterized protein n=1 Tax=Bauhinia variegata TaxID=167791 RepID=A0ACB9P7I7_BAUVA|nr:hypothetical protein L6164_011569 [Bauhinia variegata]
MRFFLSATCHKRSRSAGHGRAVLLAGNPYWKKFSSGKYVDAERSHSHRGRGKNVKETVRKQKQQIDYKTKMEAKLKNTKKFIRRLVKFEELPQDNEIHLRLLPLQMTGEGCLIFSWHNETLNIWMRAIHF